MVEKKGNKSLFLYTALIFLVALIMIVLSFFGQSNLKSTEETKQEAKTITEKASALNDENLILMEQISGLQEELEKKDAEILEKQATIDADIQTKTVYDTIISAYLLKEAGKKEEAKTALENIDATTLSGDILIMYNKIMKK